MCKQQDSVIMCDLHFRSSIIQIVTLRSHALQNWFAKHGTSVPLGSLTGLTHHQNEDQQSEAMYQAS